MKKTLLAIACLFAAATQSQAQTTLIHYWNFNNLVSIPAATSPSTFATIKADYSIISTNTAVISYRPLTGTAGNVATYYDTVAGDVLNARQSAPAGEALRLRNPSDSMEARFYMPTTGYKNVVFTFEAEASSSSNGSKSQVFSYSLDSGATWKTTGITINGVAGNTDAITAAWTSVAVGFDTTANNKSGFVVRMTFTGTDTTNKGNDRFDNATLDGTALTNGVENVAADANAISVYPNPATATVHVLTATTNEKTVTVYNIAGQVVYRTVANTKLVTLPTATLSEGMYQVLVHDNATGENQAAKFVKQ